MYSQQKREKTQINKRLHLKSTIQRQPVFPSRHFMFYKNGIYTMYCFVTCYKRKEKIEIAGVNT